MAEFPTYEQMVKNVAEKALDEFLYDGKSIREWMKIIAEQETILDKIIAEIVHLHDWAFSREEILRIIDKYRQEGI